MKKLFYKLFPAVTVLFLVTVPAYSFFWDKLSSDDGLSQNTVKSIVQDSLGRMWFGTQDGLNRFDGVELETYYAESFSAEGSFLNADILDLCVSESGIIYSAVNNNLISYNPETGVFSSFSSPEPDDFIKLSAANGDAVLILSKEHLWLFNGNSFIKIDVPFISNLFDLQTAGDGKFSVVSESGEIAVYTLNNNLITNYVFLKQPFFSSPCYYCPLNDSYLLISLNGRVYSDQSKSVIADLPLDGDVKVSDCMEGPDGELWISTLGSGIFIVNPENGSYRHESVRNGLFNDYIISLFTNSTGLVWAGSWGEGVGFYDPLLKVFQHYSPDSFGMDSADVMAVKEASDGSLWLGTLGSGILIMGKEGIVEHLSTKNGLPSDYFLSLEEDENGRIWAGTAASGLVVIDLKSRKLVDHYHFDSSSGRRILSNQVYDSLILKDGGCIIAGRETPDYQGGISVVSADGGVQFSISGPTVWSIEYAGERILLATDEGLKEYKPGSNELYDVEMSEGVSYCKKRMWSLLIVGDDRVFAGSPQGLCEINFSSGEASLWSTLNGLPNNVIYAAEEDADGNLWISSNKGLSRIDLKSGQVSSFTRVHGLQNLEFNLNSSCKTSDGRMVFGGINGINIFPPENFDVDVKPLNAFIGEISLYNVPLKPAQPYRNRNIIESTVETIDKLKLDYDENNIMFQIRAPNYHDPENNIYRYRLKGFDEKLDASEWVESGSKNYASYTNIQPGKYQFQYQAASGFNQWPEEYNTLDLVITPSFVQTPMFKIVLIILVLLIIFIVLLYIMKLFKEVEHRKAVEEQLKTGLEEKDVLLKEVHHRVKNNLAIIISLLNLQEAAIKSREDGIAAFEKTRGRIYSMSFVHEQLYLNDSISTIDMYSYIEGLKVHILNTFSVPENINVITEVENAAISLNQAIPCGLIINELITNAVKHAYPNGGPGEIRISFYETSDSVYVLRVCDNGVGYAVPEEPDTSDSIGMTIVESLVAQINGVLTIKTENGTAIEVIF